MKLLHLLISWTLLLATAHAAAPEIKFEARTSSSHIRPDDTVDLEISLLASGAKSIGEIIPPKLSPFDVLGTVPSESTQATFENGFFTVRKSRLLTLTLSPKKEGTLTIGEATVTIDGKDYKTTPITLQVDTKAPAPTTQQNPKSPLWDDPFFQDADEMMNQLLQRHRTGRAPAPVPSAPSADFEPPKGSFFLKAFPSKRSVYKGERLTVSFYLYVEEDTRAQQIEFTDLPKLKGFWKEELQQIRDVSQIRWEAQRVGHQNYRRALLAEYALVPLNVGDKTIDPLKLRVHILSSTGSAYGFGLPALRPVARISPSEKIQVLPLPEQGRPSEFAGAVGQFALQVEPPSTSLKVNTAFSVRYTLSGEGNFSTIDSLALKIPKNVELFDMKTENASGKKVFEYILIPREGGTLSLDAVPFAFFNPVKKIYERIQSQPLSLNVSGQASPTGQAPLTASTSSPPPNQPEETASAKEPPVYVRLPPLWLQRLKQDLPLILAALAWAFVLIKGLLMLVHRIRSARSASGAYRKTPLAKDIKSWQSEFQHAPPATHQIEAIRLKLLDHLVQKLPEKARFGVRRDRSGEDQLHQAIQLGLPQRLKALSLDLFRDLDALAFASSNEKEKLILWNKAINTMRQFDREA